MSVGSIWPQARATIHKQLNRSKAHRKADAITKIHETIPGQPVGRQGTVLAEYRRPSITGMKKEPDRLASDMAKSGQSAASPPEPLPSVSTAGAVWPDRGQQYGEAASQLASSQGKAGATNFQAGGQTGMGPHPSPTAADYATQLSQTIQKR